MEHTNSLLKIQQSEKLNVESNLFDVRLFLDLGTDSIKHKKDYVLPVELECFLPYGYDILPNIEQDKKNIRGLLQIEDLIKEANAAEQQEFRKNILIIGNHKAINTYPSVAKTLKKANLSKHKERFIFSESYKKDDQILLHPLKLMLATSTYEQLAVEDPDEKEMMNLLLDKITLAALLPYMADARIWPGIIKADNAPRSYDELKTILLDKLKASNPFQGQVDAAMIEAKYAIKISTHEVWEPLVSYTLDGKDEHSKILFPIDLLDEILSDHLQWLFEFLKDENEDDNQFKYSMENLGKLAIKPELNLRTDYGFFYPVIDAFLKKQSVRSGLQLLKQKYNVEDITGLLPFVEEIDLRPINWSREATQVTTEMNIAARKYKWAKERFEPSSPAADSIEQVCNDLRRASSEWHLARSRYEHLKNRVGKEGIELTLQDQSSTDGTKIDRFYTLTRKRVEAKNVVLQRNQLEKWTETYTVRQCKRSFIFKKCWNEYRTREMSRWRTWYETVIHYYTINEPIAIDYDPIGSYLEKDIDKSVIGPQDDLAKAKALAAALHLRKEEIDKISLKAVGGRMVYEGIKNRHKQIHIFDYIEGEYRDQNGIPLSTLLRELENYPYDESGITPNQKKLFIIPQLVKSLTGEITIEKYLAVHNPVGGRRTNLAPNLYIVETYKQSIQQVPGHWLGKLSHTTCLFPGETRTLKMVTESKHESSLNQDSSSKQTGAFRQKVDVRNQVRNELELENKSSETRNWSVSASGGGSWGAASAKASASASGSKTNSSSHLAKSLNDKVSEILNDVSSSNEVQFVTTSTEKASVTSTSESQIEIRNVNQGRSINYKFFQILHKYLSKVTLADLKLVVEYGHEIIPGLDVVQTKVFHLAELDDILPEIIEEERAAILRQVRSIILNRYQDCLELDSNQMPVDIKREIVISQEETYVNSGAFYLDNEVSLLPATEDYVERAREAEIKEQTERSNRINAEAKAIDAGRWMLYENVPTGYKLSTFVPAVEALTNGHGTNAKNEPSLN